MSVLSAVMLFVWDQSSHQCDRKGGAVEWWDRRHSQFCFADKLGQELEGCVEEKGKNTDGDSAGNKRTRDALRWPVLPEDTIYSTCWLWLIKGWGQRLMVCDTVCDTGRSDGLERVKNQTQRAKLSVWHNERYRCRRIIKTRSEEKTGKRNKKSKKRDKIVRESELRKTKRSLVQECVRKRDRGNIYLSPDGTVLGVHLRRNEISSWLSGRGRLCCPAAHRLTQPPPPPPPHLSPVLSGLTQPAAYLFYWKILCVCVCVYT